MRIYSRTWDIVLVMASVATGLLVAPPAAKAEMIASRMQSGTKLELVRQQLRSEIMQQQIQRFGLSQSEAKQIQAVLSDEQVIRQMARLGTQLAYASRTMIRQSMTYRLLCALESSVERHMVNELQDKLSERVGRAFDKDRLLASRLSVKGDPASTRQAFAKVHRALTAEKLVVLGMTKEDAVQTVAKLKNSDLKTIIKDNVQIGYAGELKLTYTGFFVLLIGGFLVFMLLIGAEGDVIGYVAGLVGIALGVVFVIWLIGKAKD